MPPKSRVKTKTRQLSSKKLKSAGSRRRKPRGDKLDTVELCDDGFTTDEEEQDEQYESCKHFEVQETVHHDDKDISSRRRQRTTKRKLQEKKVVSPEQVDSAELNSNVKKLKKTEESEIKKQGNVKTKSKQSSLKEKQTKNAENISTESSEGNVSPEEQEKVNRIDVVGSVKREPLPANCRKYVGAHISISGGLYRSVLDAVAIKAHAFGLFLKNQRYWHYSPMTDDAARKFRELCQEYGYLPQHILPHGSYLMNCGSPDKIKLQKSRDMLVEELQRCERLGLTMFNFHPGSACSNKMSVDKCMDVIAKSIDIAHSKTKGVITVLENMCCQGFTIGGKFEELKGIIDRVKDKSRVGVCLDTCHAFAAGYDLSTEEGFNKMMSDFDSIIGFKYLKAMHLNDSQEALGRHLDRHANIGKGHIGMEGFKRVMNHPKLDNIPMILETPCDSEKTYANEIKMLYDMCEP